jgi:hypothetical protein
VLRITWIHMWQVSIKQQDATGTRYCASVWFIYSRGYMAAAVAVQYNV